MRVQTLLMGCVVLFIPAVMFLHSSPAQAQASKTYDNPFINDGSFAEAPFNFDFNIQDTRNVVDEHGRTWIHLKASDPYDGVIAELKRRYKAKEPFTNSKNNLFIIGHVYLTRVKHHSFSLYDKTTKKRYLVLTVPRDGGQSMEFQLLSRSSRDPNAYFKRTWYGFSLDKFEPYSFEVYAY